MNYPDDATLIARGKYSTLTAERRDLLRLLNENAMALAENGRRIMRAPEDVTFSSEQIDLAAANAAGSAQIVKRIAELDALRLELRPAAWGNQKGVE